MAGAVYFAVAGIVTLAAAKLTRSDTLYGAFAVAFVCLECIALGMALAQF